VTPPDLTMPAFEAQLKGMKTQPDDTQAGTRREVVVPALGDAETDEGQDEVGDLVAKEKAGKTLLVFEVSLAQAESALEISEHFFDSLNANG
jgi:hypothetical protein